VTSAGAGGASAAGAPAFGPDILELLERILPSDDGSLIQGDLRAAAVLIALFVREDALHVVLTKRTENVRTHQGQVAFPGGSFEPGDDSLERTALRESHEEVGLDPAHVRVLGVLEDLPTFVSGFQVRPFVGEIPHPYEFVPDVSEVDHVFSPPLAVFADPSRRREEVRERDGREFVMTSYDVDGNLVWGATARMLEQLVDRIISARV
jgi:8-oxo-dGTP pyrophosphatase MutT (NUDIX family)